MNAASQRRPLDLLLVVRAAAFILMLVILTRSEADPDLWGHVFFGHDIVSSRAIPQTDHYAFTETQRWINHEWLSEITMYAAYALGGPGGLVALKMVMVLTIMALVLWSLKPYALAPAPHDALVFLAIAGVQALTTHIRPEMFSLLLFSILMVLVMQIQRGRVAALAAIPLLMMLWINFHGGWLVGMGTLGVWLGIEALSPTCSTKGRLQFAAAIVASAVITLVNPYGYRMWVFLRQTVGLSRPDISEWLPVYRLGPLLVLLWIIVAAVAVAAIVTSRRHLRASSAAVVLMLAFASFRVSRLISFFTISVVVLVAPALASVWSQRRQQPRAAQQATASAKALAVAITIVVTAVAAVSAVTLPRNLGCIQINESCCPEPEAARFIAENQLAGRMLTWFDWGEYAIWHFSSHLKVSVDGRRETVYPESVQQRHLSFFFDAPEGRQYAAQLNPDYIWIPRWLPIGPRLVADGWSTIFQGPVSLILGKSSRRYPEPLPATRTVRCFPDE